MLSEEEREQIWRWAQEEADQYHDGVLRNAVEAILAAAYVRELRPDDPWAYAMARQRGRGGRRPQQP